LASISSNIKIIPILLTFFLVELFIGGSGQVFKIFLIPVRQIIFVLLLGIFFFDLISYRIKLPADFISLIVTILILWVFASALIGLGKSFDEKIILKDVTPMLYFLIYFPLRSYFLKYKITYEYVLRLLVHSTIIMSLSVIIVFIILKVYFGGDLYVFRGVVEGMVGEDVFWFRSSGFVFYPGLIYSLVAAILLFGKLIEFKKISIYELIALFLSTLALVISMTKGLILSLAIAVFLLIFLKKTSILVRLTSMFFCALIILALVSVFDFSRFTEVGNDRSTMTRVQTIEESLFVINENMFFGNGFATELPSKKFHQENSFLDIVVEQGLIGLSFYLMLFFYIYIKRNNNIDLSIATFSVALMSLTNPYINNPLGIGLIVLTLIFLGYGKVVRNDR